jgi:hypothetical protein
MNKEQQEIIDEVYEKYHQENKHVMYLTYLLKEEFINRIKKDSEFSNKWGLKIEERELDQFERWELANLTPNMSEIDWCNKFCDEQNIPTKLITVTRELSLDERVKIFGVEKINTTDAGYYEHSYAQFKVDEANIPTTKTIESYE